MLAPVERGPADDTRRWCVAAEPGAVVIVYPGSGIAAGSRVKPAAARASRAGVGARRGDGVTRRQS